jgi:nucleoid DNA-binding protein
MELLDIVCEVSKRTRYTRREVRKLLRVAATIIKEELGQGRNVSWRGLGQFENAYRGYRTGRDPKTKGKTTMYVPPGRRLKFVPSDELIELVKKSTKYFAETDPKARYLPKEIANVDGQIRSGTGPRETGQDREREDSGWQDALFD